MGKWEMVRLGDVISVTSGGTPNCRRKEYYDDGTIPLVKTGDLKGMYINNTDTLITEKGLINSSAKVFPVGTVLVAMYGATIGACSILGVSAATNQACAALLPTKSFLPAYLYFYFLYIKEKLVTLGEGGAQPNISGSKIKNLTIPLPPLPIQQKIADVLDRASTLVEKRKAQIDKLDLLIKSQFIEMFGDPGTNPKGWERVALSSLLSGKASNGYFAKRNEYVEDGNAGILGVANIVNTRYSKYEDLPKTNVRDIDTIKYSVKYGDLLFCRSSLVAEGIGKASIVPRDVAINTLFECHVIRVPLDTKKCIPEYIQELSTTEFFRKQIISHAKTSTMTTISQSGVLKVNVLMPPYNLQDQFFKFVQEVEIQRRLLATSINQLERNYKALIQKCFRGEVF